MKQTLALIAVLGAAAAAPAMAQAPDMSGVIALSAKVDALQSATGSAQIEAAMAACLLLGADATVAQMLFTEAGWKLHEASDAYQAFLMPAQGPDDLTVELGLEAGTCGVTSNSFGGADAHQMAKGLIGVLEPGFNTVTEGNGPDSCHKYDLAMQGGQPGRIYVSVLDFSQEEPSCLMAAQSSTTTFAFEAH